MGSSGSPGRGQTARALSSSRHPTIFLFLCFSKGSPVAVSSLRASFPISAGASPPVHDDGLYSDHPVVPGERTAHSGGRTSVMGPRIKRQTLPLTRTVTTLDDQLPRGLGRAVLGIDESFTVEILTSTDSLTPRAAKCHQGQRCTNTAHGDDRPRRPLHDFIDFHTGAKDTSSLAVYDAQEQQAPKCKDPSHNILGGVLFLST